MNFMRLFEVVVIMVFYSIEIIVRVRMKGVV